MGGTTGRTGTTPTFSVVICTYNRAELLPRSIESVLAQTHDDYELVVVDDGSADRTAEVVAELATERVRYVRRDNGGLSAARNTGIAEARGDFVVFLDDDDRAHADWLAELAALVGPDVGVVSCGCRSVLPDGTEVDVMLPWRMEPPFAQWTARFLAGAFAVRRSLYADIGGYAEIIPVSHQTELSLRLLPRCVELGLDVRSVDRVLVDIEEREVTDRPLSQPSGILAGAKYLLEHHHEVLRHDPEALGRYYAMGGVAAAQCGDYREARSMLRRAVRHRPGDPQHWVRMGLAHVPPLGRRVWGRHWEGAALPG